MTDASVPPSESGASERRLRVAAIGDVHASPAAPGRWRDTFAEISRTADVLCLCGDLTNHGTVAEAEAALNRLARVNGADGVVRVGSDYRRAAIASTPLSTQTFVEVQAWGTAVSHAEARAETPPEA